MREWSVPCEWCDAKIGEPCKNEDGKSYIKLVHRPRAFQWDKEHGLSRRHAPALTHDQVKQIEEC